jgi:hypothetical protein
MSNNRTIGQRKNTSSGRGSAGMGGDPSDDPRDQHSGGGKRVDESRELRTPPVPGASGSRRRQKSEGTP